MPVGVTREHSIMGGFGNPKALSNFVNVGLGRFPTMEDERCLVQMDMMSSSF